MAYRYLYLVRHAQYDPSEASNPQGELTALGKRQAQTLVKAFKGVPVTAIHVSALARALQTAEPLVKVFPEAKVSRTRRLFECIPPLLPALRQSYFQHYTDAELAQQAQHAQRAHDAYFKRTSGADKHEVLVFHGNLIRYLACRAMGFDPAGWSNLESRNCSITRIVIEPDGAAALISYNEVGHLPPALLTDNLHGPRVSGS